MLLYPFVGLPEESVPDKGNSVGRLNVLAHASPSELVTQFDSPEFKTQRSLLIPLYGGGHGKSISVGSRLLL